MNQDIAFLESVVDEMVGLLKMLSHLVAGHVKGMEGPVVHLQVRGVGDPEHGGGCEDCDTKRGGTGSDVFIFEEVIIGGGIVVAEPELGAELFGAVDDVHGWVGLEGATVEHGC